MLDWFHAGGFNMFILAAFAIVMIATAIRFARNADPQRLSVLRASSWALLAVTLTGFITGMVSTCRFVIERPEARGEELVYLLAGFSESCSNLVFGGGIAAITWILVAVGIRRMPHDTP